MPATIQKILKPSKYRAVDTSGNNNHGQIYSGRALEFDGVSDSLSVPTGVTHNQDWRSGTIATYLYLENTPSTSDRIFSHFSDSNTRFYFALQNNGKLRHQLGDEDLFTDGNIALENKTWYRLVLTWNIDGTVNTYINGVLDKASTGIELNTSDTNMDSLSVNGVSIGSHNNTANLFDGKMSDFQMWNSTWTQSDVTYDYLNPESLVLNNGGTSLTESNLKLWYPMQDGHRGQQSYILDGANTGLGDELIVNGDYSDTTSTNSSASALAGWTNAGITHDKNNNVSISNGQATLISDGSDVRIQQTILTVGVTYKYSIDIISASSGAIKLQTSANFDSGGISAVGTHTGYFTADATVFRIRRSGACNVTFDNVSIKPVNDKHHATTEFLGDDLFDDGVGDYSDSTGGWSADGNNTIDNNDSALRITYVDDDDGARLDLNDAEDLTTDLTVGRTYRLSFEYKINQVTGSNVILQINTGTGSFVSSSALTDTSFSGTPVTKDFVATHATGALIKFNNMDSGDILHLKNFTLKEVGIASGWTDADQQLDIAQTALQSYNQLVWFNDNRGEDNPWAYASHHNDFNPEAGDFTVSAWVMQSDTLDDNYFFAKGGGGGSGWHCRVELDGTIQFSIEDNNSANEGDTKTLNIDAANFDVDDHLGEWWHFVGVINRTTDETYVYINGQLVGTLDISDIDNPIEHSSADLKFGSWATNYSNGTMNGSATEFNIWKGVAFSQSDVNELYNDGKVLDALTHTQKDYLKGYWRNNGLATWQDLTTNNRDVTIQNGRETLLLPAGVDAFRDTQGFFMNRQKDTNALNLPYNSYAEGYVDLLEETTIAADSAFSITLWVKPSHVGDNRFIGSGADYIRFRDDDELRIYANSALDDFEKTSGTWSVDEWMHLGIVRNTSNLVTIYVNGEAQTDTETVNEAFDYRYIGAFDASDTFDGAVDDVCIYNDELSAAEVKRNYNAGKRSHR